MSRDGDVFGVKTVCQKQPGQPDLRFGMALAGRFFQPLARQFRIGCAARSVPVERSQTGLGIGQSLPGRFFDPEPGFAVILRDAFAPEIEQADAQLGPGVAVMGSGQFGGRIDGRGGHGRRFWRGRRFFPLAARQRKGGDDECGKRLEDRSGHGRRNKTVKTLL